MLIGIVNKLLVKSSYNGTNLSVIDLSISELMRNLAAISVIKVLVSTYRLIAEWLHQC